VASHRWRRFVPGLSATGGLVVRTLEDKSFLLLLIIVSLAFVWVIWQFYGAVLWGIVAAIVFAPVYRQLLKPLHQRRSLAALATVALVIMIVIVPLGLLTMGLVQEASNVYESIQSGELDLGRYFQQILEALPIWATNWLGRLGMTNAGEVQQRLTTALVTSSQFFAAQALNIGQHTAEFILSLFVMLYLLFFLLRDGPSLTKQIREAIPLRAEQQRALINKFTVVVRATVKGTMIVAIVQGALGGLFFWFLGIHAALLWGVLMAFLSLLPAIGSALVWFPVAIYLLI
jgi:predicted PurR-regulated permease PerM